MKKHLISPKEVAFLLGVSQNFMYRINLRNMKGVYTLNSESKKPTYRINYQEFLTNFHNSTTNKIK